MVRAMTRPTVNGDIVGCANCGNPYEFHKASWCPYCKSKSNGEFKTSTSFIVDRFSKQK